MRDKTLTQLRGIASSFGIPDIFSKDRDQLIQAIEMKQVKMMPEPEIVIPPREYDARLMTRPPAKKGSHEEILELLEDHIKRGLHVDFPEEENWRMRFGKKEDTGTCRQRLAAILACADRIMK